MNTLFTYCPSCGKTKIPFKENKHWVCEDCGFDLFFNVASSAGLILYSGDSVLFVKRGREPAKGLLALPGGFIDAGETAEEACRRECFEETGIQAEHIRYICSFPNSYTYKNVNYNTCDFFFSSELPLTTLSSNSPLDTEEVADCVLLKLNSIDYINSLPIAFPSVKKALKEWFLRG